MAEPRELHGEGRARTSPEGWAGVRTMSPGIARVGRGCANTGMKSAPCLTCWGVRRSAVHEEQ